MSITRSLRASLFALTLPCSVGAAAQTASITSCSDFAEAAASLPDESGVLVRASQSPNLKIANFDSQLGRDVQKDEFETTDQYLQRRKKEWQRLLGNRRVIILKVAIAPTAVSYDADTQTATVRLAAIDLQSAATKQPASQIELTYQIVRDQSVSKGALTQSIGIHFYPGSLAGADSDYGGNKIALKLDVPTARQLKNSASLALMVTIDADNPMQPVLRVASTRFAERYSPRASNALELSYRVTPACAVLLSGTKPLADARPSQPTIVAKSMILPQPLQAAVIKPEGLGPVRIGDALPQVSQEAGIALEGDDSSRGEDADASCAYWGPADKKKQFPSLLAEDGKLSSITISDEWNESTNSYLRWSNIKTDRGVRLGDKVSVVKAAYPDLVREQGFDEGPLDMSLYHWEPATGLGLKFEIDDGVVTSISAGNKAIRYYEGCE